MIVAIPFQFRWTAKAEVFKAPFLGWHLTRSGHIKIVRHDRNQSLEAIQKATNSLIAGATIVIFPEGTRSIDGNLGTFKKGAFHMSLDSGLPIVPVTIVGSRDVVKKGDWNPNMKEELQGKNAISAITGATITTRAVRDSIEAGIKILKIELMQMESM